MSLCIKSQIDAFANQGSQAYISSFQFTDRKEGNKKQRKGGREGLRDQKRESKRINAVSKVINTEFSTSELLNRAEIL